MLITENLIELEAKKILEVMESKIRAWATPLSNVVVRELPQSLAKTICGQAHPNGEVHISRIFVGTTCLEGLRETLIHEFCHLITGLQHGHKAQFKRNLSALLALVGIDKELAATQKRELIDCTKKQAKYHLIAVCFDGSEVEIGEFHKKTKKYTGYAPGANPWKVDNKPIQTFKFIDHF